MRVLAALSYAAALSATLPAWGDVFVLTNDGQVRGTLVNKDEKPRQSYVIQSTTGGQITLRAEQIKQVIRQTAAEVEYDRARPKYPDTVEGNWALAAWCRDHSLLQQRKALLERIVELAPDHAEARAALGYSKKNGRWVTQEMLKLEQGYVKYKGQWRLPQEVELLENRRKAELAETGWFTKLKRWYSWLGTDRDEAARANIAAINDPAAVRALLRYLGEEEDRQTKGLFVDALAQIGGDAALGALVDAALHDPDEEIRLTCLDRLAAAEYPAAVAQFVAALKDKDNQVVNRAGVALGQMQDPSAIGALIDALETVHKFKVVKGNPGQMSSTFNTGGGGGGFSFGGGGTEIVKQSIKNREVLRALVKLAGVNFEFDRQAWKYWYAAQKKPKTLDARRD